MAKTPRGWTGARTPSAIKRVRQADRRRAINQPRRSAAKTYVAAALRVAASGRDGENAAATAEALAEAMSALDKAAKVGAIHPNAAARRKSRLSLKLNKLAGGEGIAPMGRATKSTGTAAAVKAARTRIATAKASKAKGPQTAAGKARAALSKTTRAEGAAPASASTPKPRATRGTGAGAGQTPAAKSPAAKSPAAKAPAGKAATARAATAKPASTKAAPKTPRATKAADGDKPAARTRKKAE